MSWGSNSSPQIRGIHGNNHSFPKINNGLVRCFSRIRGAIVFFIAISLTGCLRPAPNSGNWQLPKAEPVIQPTLVVIPTMAPTPTPFVLPTRDPAVPILTPTPDPTKVMPTPRAEQETYIVQAGDMLSSIARQFGVSLAQLIAVNNIINMNHVEVGQLLVIPVPDASYEGTAFKILPDSEIVNGPASASFDITGFILNKGGYMASYAEPVDGVMRTAAEIVTRVSQEYSVNPRLLLALLEYQSHWLTASNPDQASLTHPMLQYSGWHPGLYRQLAWAADTLNAGYYLWKEDAISTWLLADGGVIPIDASINAGTAAVQNLFASLYGIDGWSQAVSEEGFFHLYQGWFGYPFDLAIDPPLPEDLAQPEMQLPFEDQDVWSYTGGPHGGWADGSAWAALDFAPPGNELGCFWSNAWVVALADGLVLTSDGGAVVQDLDGDGLLQTGWSVLYMHIESRDRVKAGTYLQAGDRIGHASCEGGYSNGTHLHLARRYNGEWIPADGDIPFNLDGWISSGTGYQYDGYMTRNGTTITAWEGRLPANQIFR